MHVQCYQIMVDIGCAWGNHQRYNTCWHMEMSESKMWKGVFFAHFAKCRTRKFSKSRMHFYCSLISTKKYTSTLPQCFGSCLSGDCGGLPGAEGWGDSATCKSGEMAHFGSHVGLGQNTTSHPNSSTTPWVDHMSYLQENTHPSSGRDDHHGQHDECVMTKVEKQ